MFNVLSQITQQAGPAIQQFLQSQTTQRAIQLCLPIAAKEVERKWKEWFE